MSNEVGKPISLSFYHIQHIYSKWWLINVYHIFLLERGRGRERDYFFSYSMLTWLIFVVTYDMPFFMVFWDRLLCISLEPSLEHSLYIRVASNSQRFTCIFLTSARIKRVCLQHLAQPDIHINGRITNKRVPQFIHKVWFLLSQLCGIGIKVYQQQPSWLS